LVVARELSGKVLVANGVAGRLVEVEAYCGGEDPGSHGFRGMTARNAVMFGPPGHLYVYFTYGMHWCANVVTAPDAEAGAVLLRAAVPVAGEDVMRERRRGRPDVATGPAKLCQAFSLDRAANGIDLCGRTATVWLGDDGAAPPPFVTTPRIGLAAGRGEDLPWRYVVREREREGRAPK